MLAARKRDARAHNELFTAHYIGALLPHMKNRPPLQKLLVDVDGSMRPRRQSPAEMREALMMHTMLIDSRKSRS